MEGGPWGQEKEEPLGVRVGGLVIGPVFYILDSDIQIDLDITI